MQKTEGLLQNSKPCDSSIVGQSWKPHRQYARLPQQTQAQDSPTGGKD